MASIFDTPLDMSDHSVEVAKIGASASKAASAASSAATLGAAKIQAKTTLQVAKGGWKVQRESIAATMKIAMKELEFKREEMEKIGIPTMQAKIWFEQQQIRLADQAHSMAQSNLGMEYLKFSSTLRGPENYFQAADFSRGASQRQDVPIFLQNLKKNLNEGNTQFQAPGEFAPDPVTSDSLMNKLQYTGPNPTIRQDSAALNAFDQVFSMGAHRLRPGALEGLDESELALLSSAGDKLGYDVPRWLRDYSNSRVGTEAPNLA